MYEPVRASDIECAKGRLVEPRDLDSHQLLQVHGLGHWWRLVHVCRVVNGRNVEVITPLPLLIALTEDFVANTLDVGDGLQDHCAFT